MPSYDATRHGPPAPVAEVSLRESSSITIGRTVISNVSLLIDTGADITLLPRSAVTRLGVTPEDRRGSLWDGSVMR